MDSFHCQFALLAWAFFVDSNTNVTTLSNIGQTFVKRHLLLMQYFRVTPALITTSSRISVLITDNYTPPC